MNPAEIIRKKRDGGRLAPGELEEFFIGYLSGKVGDYQASALLMSIYFRGMDPDEVLELTKVMAGSGERVDLGAIPGLKVDKHSTGGVGDKVSLILAPLAAACGATVPMISGRGLGHTGGTLDKLESIPGFRTDLDPAEFRKALSKVGVCMIGQTEKIAPLDRKLYALRDVTGTVESIPLITASILSKKYASGIDGLVLDIKVGRGAFMKDKTDARLLAGSLVSVGRKLGLKVEAVLTDMNEPLGRAVGNSVEVLEAAEALEGRCEARLREVTFELCSRMLTMSGAARTPKRAEAAMADAIRSGKAMRKFLEMIKAQGGDPGAVEKRKLPLGDFKTEVKAPKSGYISIIDPFETGILAMDMGAGRAVMESRIDPGAGILFRKSVGDKVEKGETVAEAYFSRESMRREISERLTALISYCKVKTSKIKVLLAQDRLGARFAD